jgi:RNA polymerase sigma-54 factor
MAIELKQQLRISQQLVMTPQLQQAIKLLQLNQLELVNLVQQELQENPVLEESDVEEETQAEREDATLDDYDESGEPDRNADEAGEGTESTAESESVLDPSAVAEVSLDERLASSELPAEGAGSDEIGPTDAEKIADVEWEQYLDSHPMTGLDAGGMVGDDDRPSLEATYARRPSLADHLEWQLQVTDLDEAGFAIANWIIGNIDDRGFLRSSIEEISRQADVEESDVALRVICASVCFCRSTG